MNRARTLLRVCNSLISTGFHTTRPLLTQVTYLSPFASCSLSNQFHTPFTIQKLFFSSKPNSIVQLLLTNDWSSDLENELEKVNPALTHESVVYVLKRLDQDPVKAWDFFNWVCKGNEFRLSSQLYCVLLMILVNNDTMKYFWVAIRKMKEQGFHIDRGTYMTILGRFKKQKMDTHVVALTQFYDGMVKENAMDSVVNNVVDIILKAEWSDEVEKDLGAMLIELTSDFVIRVLNELRNRNLPLKALRFFNWVSRCEGFENNAITYNAILRVLSGDDSIGEFWNVVEEMKNAGFEMDIDSYIKISRHFRKFKMLEDAVKLYEFMMDSPFKPSVQDCSILLRSISVCENPDLNLVFRVVKKFEATGNSLSKSIYDGMHRSLTSAGKFDEAENIMKVMRNSGFDPDNITYSQLVFGLCKARKLEEACKVLDEMEADGCTPDIKTWTILIQGHCAANQLDTALMCFSKMIEKNLNPDADLLDVLINGFLGQKRIDGAYTLLVEMVTKVRLVPWQATCKLLIEKLLGIRKLEEAMNLLQLMKKHNYPPFPEPFVQYISKFGTVQDAVDFFKALSVKQYPSVAVYHHVFKSFFEEGRHSEAKDLLFKCPHHIRTHPKICELFGHVSNGVATA